MAWIVGDGFDYYANVADLARSVWDSVSGNFLFATGRFGTGQALRQSSGVPWVQKNLASNEGTIFAALAYYRPGALAGTTAEAYIYFRDGATVQCTVVFDSGGNIVLRSGIETGTVLATYAAAFAQDVWTHFQIRVVISNTAGSMTVRKNGQTSDSYASATNLNTRGGTANNYANVLVFNLGSSAAQRWVDDLLFYSGSGAVPNDWVGDVRAVCLAPAADTAQKQFAAIGSPVTAAIASPSSNAVQAANTLHFTGPFVCTRSGVVTKATLTLGNVTLTGNSQVAFYAADAAPALPGTLLGTSAVVTSGTLSTPIDFIFTGGPTLVQGRSYYLAFLADTAPSGGWATATVLTHYTQARTYALGFPNPAGAVAGPSGSGQYATLTVSGNVAVVSEALANADTDYVFDATVGDSDLYDMDELQFTPLAIIGVVSKVYVKKSDAGTRNAQILVSSGGTQVAGPDTPLSSTYTYLSKVDAVDPATGAAWTNAGLNAIKVGQKVSA